MRPIETVPLAEVYTTLATHATGLTRTEAAARLAQYGRNTIHQLSTGSLWRKCVANFTHLMALLLWIGGLIGFLAQLPQLGLAIWMVNLINGAFSFWQEYKAEQATEALRRLLPAYVRVVREGTEQRLLAEELVPGDVMVLTEGDHISADCRLVAEAELRVDQSALTGESHPVRKTAEALLHSGPTRAELANLVFAGTSVAAGTATAVVFATGMQSEFGKIAHLTQAVGSDLSPLQKEMAHTTKMVTMIALGVGLLFFLLAVSFTRVSLAESMIFALGMIVAFVPEGLLPTVTLALAMGTQRMARRQALIKRLSAVETLGCTTAICTDKTGTLTQNAMTVRELWLGGRWLTVSGVGYAPAGEILEQDQPLPCPVTGDLQHLLLAAGLCNDARILPPNSTSPAWIALGDPTEAALRVVASKAGLDLEAAAQAAPRLRELPFDSRRKRMSTVHQAPRDTGRLIYVKGAPREVLHGCCRWLRDGQEVPLTPDLVQQIMAANDAAARRGLRVLAVAQRLLHEEPPHWSAEAVECELTFLGLCAMMDPPRPEVAEAVARCHRAGIRIIMMTGDYGLTAESIARRIGIIRGAQPRLLTGADLNSMDEQSLQAALQEEVIFARVAPEQKLQVVTALQALGHVVAVTGDGVNDAPALKKADIGVAMGLGGTDVAKEAADMVLADDNFASIVNAVEEGRAVYANIKKFVLYILTSNTPEAVPFVLFALSGGRIPLALTVMQVLSIDLGTDIVPALALGVEPPEPGIMDHPPRRLSEHVITRALLLRAYAWLGLIQSVAAMAAFYGLYWTQGFWGQWLDLPANGPVYRMATAMTLAAVVATQIGNLFAQRTEYASVLSVNPWSNPWLWVGVATELGLLVLLLYTPWLQHLFDTAALPPVYWLALGALMPVLLLADEGRKALRRRRLWRRRQTSPPLRPLEV
ncbi:MAG: cation-translocating P-type ATPase [Candidatus Tectimicrobiota bacterium]